jgi:lysophospholipase L1-like esterase
MKRRLLSGAAICALLTGLLWAGTNPAANRSREAERTPWTIPFHPADSAAIDPARNVIIDSAGSLTPFYEQLARLQTADSTAGRITVSILHLGDSHIQAGFLTGTTMRCFHRDFGNAGRGLITPLRIAGTNEPSDYAIRSPQTWDHARLTQSVRPWPVGLGGVAIAAKQANFSLTVSALDRDDPQAYRFNRVHVFKHPDAPDLRAEGASTDTASRYDQTLLLDSPTTEITLSNSNNKLHDLVYYNFLLESEASGVLYHAAGINGAQYLHWMRVPELERQIEALQPQLVILSMGTNEARMGRSFSADRFAEQIDELVRRVRAGNPSVTILLTTPPDSYLSRRIGRRTVYEPNPLVAGVAAVIRDYAAHNNLACWDLLTVSGGPGTCRQWFEAGLYGRDRLHFTAEGYAIQGKSLYQALLTGYNQYVRDRYGESAPTPEI